MATQRLFIREYLPTRPLASNNLSEGLWRHSKAQALEEKRFIETSPKGYTNFLVFDIDAEDADLRIKEACFDDEQVPAPNWISLNPASGHAHTGYILKSPVGTPKGQAYLRHVQEGLRRGLGGDRAYRGRITRNPAQHPTEWLTEKLWTLKELEAGIDANLLESTYAPRAKKGSIVVNGRNDALFESLRGHAYASYRRLDYNSEALRSELHERALELNLSDFETPLSSTEVLNIVRSIHRFTISNFSKEEFSRIQSARARKRWGSAPAEREAKVQAMLRDGLTARDVANELGLTLDAARKACQRAKRAKRTM